MRAVPTGRLPPAPHTPRQSLGIQDSCGYPVQSPAAATKYSGFSKEIEMAAETS